MDGRTDDIVMLNVKCNRDCSVQNDDRVTAGALDK